MKQTSFLVGALCLVGAAQAQSIDLPRNTVLEVVSEQDLNLKKNREGDRVYATIANDRELPRGSRLVGEVTRVEPAYRDQPGYMDVVFTGLELPGGDRVRLDAIPVPLNSRGISRTRDGRLVADPKKVKTDQYVVGGLIGGLIFGSLIKKPFEGTFVGGLVGIVLAESEKQNAKKRQDLVLRRGDHLGAMLDSDVHVDISGYGNDRWNARDPRDDRRDPRDDRRDPRDDRRDSRVIDIRCDDRALSFNRGQEPFRRGADIYVPLSVASQLDLEVDRRDSRIYVDGKEASLRLDVGSRDYRLNGRSGTLPEELSEQNGEVYIPIRLIAALSAKRITADGSVVAPGQGRQ